MGVVVNLPKELEDELSEEASRSGMSLSEYISRILASGRTVAARPENGSQLVEFWRSEDLIGSRPDIGDGAARARELRREVERRGRK
ncbi:MAG: hypothetical protein H0U65_05550 [Rubrobacter sp.]|nr:hypothetical protein [Rubrobacter sp.]